MFPSKGLAVALTFGTFITVMACTTGTSTGESMPDWTRYLNQSNFPARVEAVIFPSGNAIDQTHSVSWGKTTVGLGSDLPIAEYSSPGVFSVIDIRNLSCRNDVYGTIKCDMQLMKSSV